MGKKEVYVYLSKADRVIPYEHGARLVREMKKEHLNPKVIENKYLGHYLTIHNFSVNATGVL